MAHGGRNMQDFHSPMHSLVSHSATELYFYFTFVPRTRYWWLFSQSESLNPQGSPISPLYRIDWADWGILVSTSRSAN